MDCFAALAMTALALMPGSKNLPRFRRACDLAARLACTGSDPLDQLPVRRHLGAVGEIKRVLEPGAEVTAEIGAALEQRPDFGAPVRSVLQMPFRQFIF